MNKGLSFLKGAMVALATVGIVFPQTQVLAGEQKLPKKPVVKTVAANSILDISLAKDGTFTGRTVDHTGNPVEGAKVVVKQGKIEVAQAVTDDNGNFAVNNLKSGVYQFASGGTEGSYRVWTAQTAPPSAMPHGLLVLGENGARGQFGSYEGDGGTLLLVGLAAAGLGLGIAGIVVASDAKRKADNAFHSP